MFDPTTVKTPLQRLSLAALLAIVLVPLAAVAEPALVAGKDYTLVAPAKTPERLPEGKVEVIEFFWYACPHCNTLEPALEQWKKPKGIEFSPTPAILGASWVVHAHVFYALEILKRGDLHARVFKAIHEERRPLNTSKDFAEYFDRIGEIEAATVLKIIDSFAVKIMVKKAERLGRRYQLRSVPTFIVQDRYQVTLENAKGSPKRLLEIIDLLVAMEIKKMTVDKPVDKQEAKTPKRKASPTNNKAADTKS